MRGSGTARRQSNCRRSRLRHSAAPFEPMLAVRGDKRDENNHRRRRLSPCSQQPAFRRRGPSTCPPMSLSRANIPKSSCTLATACAKAVPLAQNCRQETRDWAQTIEAAEKSKASEPPSKAPVFGRRYDISSIRRRPALFQRDPDERHRYRRRLQRDRYQHHPLGFPGERRITIAPFFKESADGGPTMTTLLAAATGGLTVKIGEARAAALVKTLRPSLTGIVRGFTGALDHARQELRPELSFRIAGARPLRLPRSRGGSCHGRRSGAIYRHRAVRCSVETGVSVTSGSTDRRRGLDDRHARCHPITACEILPGCG